MPGSAHNAWDQRSSPLCFPDANLRCCTPIPYPLVSALRALYLGGLDMLGGRGAARCCVWSDTAAHMAAYRVAAAAAATAALARGVPPHACLPPSLFTSLVLVPRRQLPDLAAGGAVPGAAAGAGHRLARAVQVSHFPLSTFGFKVGVLAATKLATQTVQVSRVLCLARPAAVWGQATALCGLTRSSCCAWAGACRSSERGCHCCMCVPTMKRYRAPAADEMLAGATPADYCMPINHLTHASPFLDGSHGVLRRAEHPSQAVPC